MTGLVRARTPVGVQPEGTEVVITLKPVGAK